MEAIYYNRMESPIGEILVTANDRAITRLLLKDQKHFPQSRTDWQLQPNLAILQQAILQLNEYFQHQRQTFDLPLEPAGTAFQQQVWQQLGEIAFGQTCSYGELARAIAQPQASRAVGSANGRNPIAILIPCHRVIASNGKLTGYAGGLDRKQWLLKHEHMKIQENPQQQLSLL